VHSLRRGAAEALELVAHGDAKSSRVVGRRIEELDFPKGATIGAIVRRHIRAAGRENDAAPVYDYEVLMAHHDIAIEPDDHVIVFVVNKRIVPKVEKLFQVNVSFL
jgi:trk system potassium uptake protein TrkA